MAEKLSITIFLEGAAEIERQLEGIGQAGTKAFDAIGTAAEKAGGFEKLDPKDVTAKLQEFGVKGKAAIDKITAAVAQAGRLERVVSGVRAVEAGFASIGVAASAMSQRVTGAFTAIATAAAGTGGAIGRVGRSLGLLGSGALIGSLGAAALAMEKAADSARILEGNLQALFRNQQAGTQFFNQIQNAARTAGASLESTAQTMIGVVNAIQQALRARGFRFAPGEGLKQAMVDAEQLFDTLQKGMKLSGARAEEANKAIAALFNEIRTKGALTGETLRRFAAQFPQLANEIVEFLGIPGETMEQLADRVDRGLKRIDITAFTNAIKRATPEIQRLSDAFDPTLAQRMDTIAGAWDRLLNSFGKSPAGAAIKGFLDDIAKGLDEIAKKQEQVGKFTVPKPPETVTGKLLQQTFDEFNQNIEIAKQNWERFKTFVTSPVEIALALTNLNPAVLAINKVIEGIQQLRAQTKDKITVPFEAAPEPAWVQAYLGFIEQVKSKFRDMFKTEAEAPSQQPAWVEAYLGWIEKVKKAFLDMFTKRPEVGGSLGGGAVPLMGLPPELEAIGAARIEDRRSPQLEAMRAAAQAVFAQIEQMGAAAFAAVAASAAAAATSIATAFGQLGEAITTALAGAQTALTAVTASVSAGAAPWTAMATAIQTAGSAITQFASSLAGVTWGAIDSGVAAWNAIVGAVQQASSTLQQFASSLSSISWDSVSAGASAWNQVTQAIREATNALQQYNAAVAGGGFAAGGPVGGFQGGGLLGGRGTGTSDSNLVRVSRGEYIIPARAVRQPGVLAFLEALRRSGGRLQDIIDDMGRFALGGLVPRTMPAFAAGGLAAGGMSNVTIQFPGLPEITGLRAPEKVVDELRKSAALAQVRSGGRKPSRYT